MKLLLSAATAALMLATPAFAQSTDGALSATDSTGTFDVNVTVEQMVRVSGLDAINLTIDPATIASNWGTTSGLTRFCVYSNVTTAGLYNVRVTGVGSSDTGNPYALAGTTSGTTLNHTVGYHDNGTYDSVAATFMRNSLTKSASTTRNGQARATTLDCSNNGLAGNNASLRVGIRNPVALAAVADEYKGTLNVIVSVP